MLKTIHKRQDSALRKYESQESYLPHLLKSHEEEMRVLTSKYKKVRIYKYFLFLTHHILHNNNITCLEPIFSFACDYVHKTNPLCLKS